MSVASNQNTNMFFLNGDGIQHVVTGSIVSFQCILPLGVKVYIVLYGCKNQSNIPLQTIAIWKNEVEVHQGLLRRLRLLSTRDIAVENNRVLKHIQCVFDYSNNDNQGEKFKYYTITVGNNDIGTVFCQHVTVSKSLKPLKAQSPTVPMLMKFNPQYTAHWLSTCAKSSFFKVFASEESHIMLEALNDVYLRVKKGRIAVPLMSEKLTLEASIGFKANFTIKVVKSTMTMEIISPMLVPIRKDVYFIVNRSTFKPVKHDLNFTGYDKVSKQEHFRGSFYSTNSMCYFLIEARCDNGFEIFAKRDQLVCLGNLSEINLFAEPKKNAKVLDILKLKDSSTSSDDDATTKGVTIGLTE